MKFHEISEVCTVFCLHSKRNYVNMTSSSFFCEKKKKHIVISPHRQAGSPIAFCSAASFSLRGCRVPSKALFTAKHLTVLGSFPNCSFKASQRKKKGGKGEEKDYITPLFFDVLCNNPMVPENLKTVSA